MSLQVVVASFAALIACPFVTESIIELSEGGNPLSKCHFGVTVRVFFFFFFLPLWCDNRRRRVSARGKSEWLV